MRTSAAHVEHRIHAAVRTYCTPTVPSVPIPLPDFDLRSCRYLAVTSSDMATGNGWARVRLQLLLLPQLLLGLGLRASAAAVGDRIQSVGPLEPTAGGRWLRGAALCRCASAAAAAAAASVCTDAQSDTSNL